MASIERSARTLPDGKTRQAIVANGMAIDSSGVVHIADTARGAIWRMAVNGNGQAQTA